MKPSSSQLSFSVAALLALTTLPAAADSVAFGPAGELYRLRQGAAGELFGAAAADPAAPALALDTTLADGTVSRIAIPGTDDARSEEKTGLLFDEASKTLILHWFSRGEDGAAFHFASFDTELSPVGTLQNGADPVLFAADPQLAISRDAFATQVGGNQALIAHRTVLHLAWRDGATARARYAPVIFVEGQWVGWTETLDLSGLVRAQHDPADFAPTTGALASHLALRFDEARHAAALTVADGMSGRLAELEIRFQPMSLEQVGERVRNRYFRLSLLYKPSGSLDSGGQNVGFVIVGLGHRGLGADTLTAMVDGLQRGIIQMSGISCNPGAEPSNVYLGIGGIGKDAILGLPPSPSGEVHHLALLGHDQQEMQTVIGSVGFVIVGLGSVGCPVQGEPGTLVQVDQSGQVLHVSLTGRRLAIDPANGELFGSSNGQREALAGAAAVWMRNEATAPVSADGPAAVMVGPETGEFVAAWVDGEVVRYRKTERSLWHEPATIPLSEEMTFENAIGLLRQNLP